MPVISPFRGLRYNSDLISSISHVVAPPYDVIDPGEEEALRARDPHNIVHLTLGKTPPDGRPTDEYTRAATALREWRRDNYLVQDEAPSIYILEQSFRVGSDWVVRRGFISALMLEELGTDSVHPHEHTMSSPKDDRFNLTHHCQTKLSQIMAVYSDSDGQINQYVRDMRSGEPLYSFTDDNEVTYRFWNVQDSEAIYNLVDKMKNQQLVIADGHHRYESSLSYAQQHRDDNYQWGKAPEDYIGCLCISVNNSGLLTLPTHRLVRSDTSLDPDALLSAVGDHFNVVSNSTITADTAEQQYDDFCSSGEDAIGCVFPDGRFVSLSLDSPQTMQNICPDRGRAWCSLPVTILHNLILPDLFGLDPETGANSDRIDFHHDVETTFSRVHTGDYDMAFLLPPTPPSAVQRIASEGDRLPQKSTYFYPKIASGLVAYPHEDGVIPYAE